MHVKFSAVLGTIGVTMGAFGAHYFKSLLTPDQLASYKTGVLYLLVHALLLLILSLHHHFKDDQILQLSWKLIAIGVILFSGSIFILSIGSLLPFAVRWLGPITPIGGLLMILGWLNLVRY